jgi:YVTN family beta-propeller protein
MSLGTTGTYLLLPFTPDGKLIYVSNSGVVSVSAIDTAAMKVVANISAGKAPKRINTLFIKKR